MATGPLSIKLRCASWAQLATIYKRDLSRGTMFLKATSPPPIGTEVRIDLALPSASVIVLHGTVDQHVTDAQRGAGVEVKLAPIAPAHIYMIESALAAEQKRRQTPPSGVPVAPMRTGTSGPVAAVDTGQDVSAAEEELVAALDAEAESLRKLNPFLVLGVGYEASDTDVRAAFGELTKRYHPDLFARYESKQLRETAAEIFIVIRDAYRKLASEQGRQAALAALGRSAAPRAVPLRHGTPPPVPVRPPPAGNRSSSSQIIPKQSGADGKPAITVEPAPPPPPRPETDFASTARRSYDAQTARAEITPPPAAQRPVPTPTVQLPPGQTFPQSKVTGSGGMKPQGEGTSPAPTAATGAGAVAPVEAESNPIEDLIENGKYEEAIGMYRLASKKNPQDRSARAGIELCEGLRALSKRDRMEAAQRFEAALEIDPSNERAARELADMRRQATNERKGLLTRLMGKKES
ncbi:MAG: DnaJ domain-containing protein [Myxococcales bacterium]|nr:DnaJ domain-containing protein [Myxococcales bacterium]